VAGFSGIAVIKSFLRLEENLPITKGF